MSRKTTSGANASNAASASAPLRHSPATANSGNAANSCRTPLRAAGSSSAIRAFHLAGFAIWFRTHFAIWHSQGRDCTAFRARCDLERSFVTVESTQPLARVFDSVSRRYRCIGIYAGAIVNDGDLQYVVNSLGGYK